MPALKRFFDRNHLVFGILLGILVPTLTFVIVMGLAIAFMNRFQSQIPVSTDLLGFVAVAANLLPFRYYMVNLRYEKTGKGILLVTFIIAFINVFFVLGAEEGWF